jgi:hypothetical protein
LVAFCIRDAKKSGGRLIKKEEVKWNKKKKMREQLSAWCLP